MTDQLDSVRAGKGGRISHLAAATHRRAREQTGVKVPAGGPDVGSLPLPFVARVLGALDGP